MYVLVLVETYLFLLESAVKLGKLDKQVQGLTLRFLLTCLKAICLQSGAG